MRPTILLLAAGALALMIASGAAVAATVIICQGYGLGHPCVGTPQDDVIYGTDHRDFMDSKEGDDTVYARGAVDTVQGGSGNDLIYGDSGEDYIQAGDPNVPLIPTPDNDVVHGGPGPDSINGAEGDDVIYGGDGDDHILFGYTGEDILYGGDGNDYLNVGTDAQSNRQRDILHCGPGEDRYTADKADVVSEDCEIKTPY